MIGVARAADIHTGRDDEEEHRMANDRILLCTLRGETAF
jgi:hypothetical protein